MSEQDTREQLEADVHSTIFRWGWDSEWSRNAQRINECVVMRWLDRQAAITERETVKQWEDQAAQLVNDANSARAKVDELTAERDQLSRDLTAEHALLLQFEDDNERLREHAINLTAEVIAGRRKVDELRERLDAMKAVLDKWVKSTVGIEPPDYPITEFQPKDKDRRIAELTAERDELQAAIDAMGNGQFYAMYEGLRAEVDNLRKRNDSQADTIRRLRAEFDAALDDLARAVEDKRSHPF